MNSKSPSFSPATASSAIGDIPEAGSQIRVLKCADNGYLLVTAGEIFTVDRADSHNRHMDDNYFWGQSSSNEYSMRMFSMADEGKRWERQQNG